MDIVCRQPALRCNTKQCNVFMTLSAPMDWLRLAFRESPDVPVPDAATVEVRAAIG